MSAVGQDLLRDAVDLHVHAAPSPYPRRFGPVGASSHAAEAGMRAVALKSHHHSTAPDVRLAEERAGEVPVELIGGIVLNSQVGGFNPHAVNLCLEMGGRIVWMPTISSPAHIRHMSEGRAKFPTSEARMLPEPAIGLHDESGAVRADALEVFKLIAEADAVLASGHLSAASVVEAFELARSAGVRRLLVNHPNFIVEADRSQTARLLELGAVFEHATCMYDDESRFKAFELRELVEWIRAVGTERTTLASDLGQAENPLPGESFSRILEALAAEGFEESELRRMVSHNPARLVGIEV